MSTKADAEAESCGQAGDVQTYVALKAAHPPIRRIWPITALLVIAAYYLTYMAALNAAFQFIGNPLRQDYISAGMACLTTLPAFAAMIWCGLQRGSRHGLWLIGVPAALMTFWGINWLATSWGILRDPDPKRTPDLADLFSELTLFSWAVAVLFVGLAVATKLLRQRARHTQKDSAA